MNNNAEKNNAEKNNNSYARLTIIAHNKIVLLLVLLVLVFIIFSYYFGEYSSTLVFSEKLIFGIASSLITTIAIILFIDYRQDAIVESINRNLAITLEKVTTLESRDQVVIHKEIDSIYINKQVTTNMWLDLINDLDNPDNSAYFVGNQLERWRATERFCEPLKRKIASRLRKASVATNEVKGFYILLNNDTAIERWIELFDSIIVNISGTEGKNLIDLGIYIISNKIRMPYSAIICNNDAGITCYTVDTNSVDESITFFIKSGSEILHSHYVSDIKKLITGMS